MTTRKQIEDPALRELALRTDQAIDRMRAAQREFIDAGREAIRTFRELAAHPTLAAFLQGNGCETCTGCPSPGFTCNACGANGGPR